MKIYEYEPDHGGPNRLFIAEESEFYIVTTRNGSVYEAVGVYRSQYLLSGWARISNPEMEEVFYILSLL